MATKGNAFVKGGCGCLAAFLMIGFLFIIMGGSMRIDPGGVCLLFVIGGIIGLVVLWIYNKGARETGSSSRPPPTDSPDFSNWDGHSTNDRRGEFDDWGNTD